MNWDITGDKVITKNAKIFYYLIRFPSCGLTEVFFDNSYPPKKKKYPGISLANVGTSPLNNPRIPSSLNTCFVMDNGVLK